MEVITGEGLNGKFARVCEIAVRAQNVFFRKKKYTKNFAGVVFFNNFNEKKNLKIIFFWRVFALTQGHAPLSSSCSSLL